MGMCSCDGSIEDYAWIHYGPSDFYPFNEYNDYKRRVRCCSCSELIDFKADCVSFSRVRAPRGEYEEGRFGEEVPIASLHMCEDCAAVYVQLWDLGFTCMSPDTPIKEHLEEYWQITGFDPKKYE